MRNVASTPAVTAAVAIAVVGAERVITPIPSSAIKQIIAARIADPLFTPAKRASECFMAVMQEVYPGRWLSKRYLVQPPAGPFLESQIGFCHNMFALDWPRSRSNGLWRYNLRRADRVRGSDLFVDHAHGYPPI